MVRHFDLVLDGSVQRLSSALAGSGIDEVQAKYLALSADADNSGVIYLGGWPQTVSDSSYGLRIEIPVTSIPPAPTIVELSQGVADLSEWQVLGTDQDVLHILAKW